jgi:hypothetical protein
MKIAISISTYYRQDGKSAKYLRRCLDSIDQQLHRDFVVYLYGDNYDPYDELSTIISEYESRFIIKHKNLPVAIERTRYINGGLDLWRCGGSNCSNIIIDDILTDGLEYVAHLDHDDYWSPYHLYVINSVIESEHPAFVYTASTYMGSILPRIELPIGDMVSIQESYPQPSNLIHSSVCINFNKLPFRYRDTFYEIGIPDAADADMWRRCAEHIKRNNLKSYLIELVTCFHETENQ